MFSFFKKLFKGFDPEIIEVEEASTVEQGGFDYDALWEDVTLKLKKDVTTRISIPKGRAYFYIASQPHKNVFTYVGGYSVRGKFASFGIEAYCGEDGRDAIQAMIDAAPQGHIIRETEAKQGTRNKTKWTWAVATSIDVPREELVKWYVDVIVDIYSFLEAQKTLQAEMFESDEAVAVKTDEPQEARNYDKYAINGTGNYGKARMVEAVVNTYVKNNPSITIEALQEVFPHHLLKGYGVIRTEDGTIKDYKRFYKSQLPNGTVFYICNQWGKDNTENFVQYVNDNVAGVKISNAGDQADAVVTAAATKVAVEKAQVEAEKAEAERMKAEAEKMRAEAAVAAAEKAQAEAMKKAQAEAEAAKKELEALKKAQAEVEAAKKEAERMKAEADKMRAEAEKARLEAEKAKAEAEMANVETSAPAVTMHNCLYNVFLRNAGAQKLAVVKAVKESCGLGLKEAHDFVYATPCLIKAAVSKAEADAIKKEIEEAGGDVYFRSNMGALPGVFTMKDGKKIRFSQGNLQFHPKNYEFRFAENQYETLGKEANEKCSPTLDGWIDIFGWGTSGYMGCQPTENDAKKSSYGPQNGDTLTSENANYDWGVYNPITNGGNKEGLWRTISPAEWNYLSQDRPNADRLKLLCMVCGEAGFALLPDDFWSNRLRFPVDITADKYAQNQFNSEQWEQLEELGVVFFPYSHYKFNGSTYAAPRFWSWTRQTYCEVDGIRKIIDSYDICKMPVRLIQDVE